MKLVKQKLGTLPWAIMDLWVTIYFSHPVKIEGHDLINLHSMAKM